MVPKVFISYSWTTQAHRDRIREWAERLLIDGVDVILDQFDLQEGQDKYAFMERMVTDDAVSHVLAFCDHEYAEKADARKKGVGVESQIISKEVYDRVKQSKFIPVVCEFNENGVPYLPRFFASRIWLDFSTPEAVNDNWERLIRLLYGKPLNQKPEVGRAPSYVTEESSIPAFPARAKFQTFRQAFIQDKKGLNLYRQDFIDQCIDYANQLRVRTQPDAETLAEKILEDCSALRQIRDLLVDWILLEAASDSSDGFSESLLETLERILDLKSRPEEVTQWNESWFEAHRLFAYETFIYIVAALLRARAFGELNNVFTSHYLRPRSERSGDIRFDTFDTFYAYSDVLNSLLAPAGRKLLSPAAELIKRQAQREDISFDDVMEADLLILLMTFVTPNTKWYPQTLYYASWHNDFPFFMRASQHKNFEKLAKITGVPTADALREQVKQGHERLETGRWHELGIRNGIWSSMNMDGLDTLK